MFFYLTHILVIIKSTAIDTQVDKAIMYVASTTEHNLARWWEECQVGPGGRWRAQCRMWSREPSGKGLLGDPPALHP